jgi:hypothetical protein
LGAATLLNLHWPISMGDSAGDLRAGYYLWIAVRSGLPLLSPSYTPTLSRRARQIPRASHHRARA